MAHEAAKRTVQKHRRKQLKRSTVRGIRSAVICAMAAFGGLQLLNAQAPPSSARAFVTAFYKWYVPHALKDSTEPTWHIALREKRYSFDSQLLQLLQADSAAQAKCEDLVGLDFDPFLNSQDPAPRYKVGEIKSEGNSY